MTTHPATSEATVAWLLVAVFFSLTVAAFAALLKIRDGARLTAAVSSAGVAFAGSLALCVPTFTAAGLL